MEGDCHSVCGDTDSSIATLGLGCVIWTIVVTEGTRRNVILKGVKEGGRKGGKEEGREEQGMLPSMSWSSNVLPYPLHINEPRLLCTSRL